MELYKTITLTYKRFDEYKREKVEKEKIIKMQKKCRNVLKICATTQSPKVSLDRQQQYSRRNCTLIHRLPDTEMKTSIKLLSRP